LRPHLTMSLPFSGYERFAARPDTPRGIHSRLYSQDILGDADVQGDFRGGESGRKAPHPSRTNPTIRHASPHAFVLQQVHQARLPRVADTQLALQERRRALAGFNDDAPGVIQESLGLGVALRFPLSQAPLTSLRMSV
jgi:hypothetical protein